MKKKFLEIIIDGMKRGAPMEDINAELKAAGANFHMNPDGSVANWTEQEMNEGFKPGKPVEDVVHLSDLMKRHAELAGKTVEMQCAEGKYTVTYNARGYAIKGVRK